MWFKRKNKGKIPLPEFAYRWDKKEIDMLSNKIQEENQSLSTFFIDKNPKLSYQDCTNVYLYQKIAELEDRINKLTAKVTIEGQKLKINTSSSTHIFFGITDIRNALDIYNTEKYKKAFNSLGMEVDKNIRFIRIGCESENHLFSINELQQVVDIYNKLNS